jgi:two-component system, chemotaxis family, protein-glutamate methylesterase/glutaminase
MSEPSGPQASFKVVGLAASAGGLSALSEVLAALPGDFPAPVVLVQHLDPKHRSLMAEILGRRTRLQVRQAAEGDRIAPGGVWVAPPAFHLLVNGDGTLSLTRTELVHFVRPSADLLFESMAAGYRDRSIAVVLTGTGMDGEMGVRAVKSVGGIVIAQDQETSEYFGMPGAAIKTGCVDFILPLDRIAATLIALVMGGETP